MDEQHGIEYHQYKPQYNRQQLQQVLQQFRHNQEQDIEYAKYIMKNYKIIFGDYTVHIHKPKHYPTYKLERVRYSSKTKTIHVYLIEDIKNRGAWTDWNGIYNTIINKFKKDENIYNAITAEDTFMNMDDKITTDGKKLIA